MEVDIAQGGAFLAAILMVMFAVKYPQSGYSRFLQAFVMFLPMMWQRMRNSTQTTEPTPDQAETQEIDEVLKTDEQ